MAARVRAYNVRNRKVQAFKHAAQSAIRQREAAYAQAARAEDARRDAVYRVVGLQAKIDALALPLKIDGRLLDSFAISPHVFYDAYLDWSQIKRIILGRAQDALITQVREAFAPLRDSNVGPREFAKAVRDLIAIRVDGVGFLHLDDVPIPGGWGR